MSDILFELRKLVFDLESMPEDGHQEFAYTRLADLVARFRPEYQKTGLNKALDLEVTNLLPNKVEATKFVRSKLGVSLREAADYVERVAQSK